MSSTGFNKLPVELALEISQYLDHVSIARLSGVCKNLSHILKDSSQEAAREYAFLPTLRAPRCDEIGDEIREWDRRSTRPRPSASHIEMAIIENRIESLRAFLDAGVDPNSFGTDGLRLLGTALRNLRLDAVKKLLEYKVDVNLRVRSGRSPWRYFDREFENSPLAYACRALEALEGHPAVPASYCPRTNYDVDVVLPIINAGYESFSSFDISLLSTRRDFPHIMISLLDKGLDLKDLSNPHGTGALIGAACDILHWPYTMRLQYTDMLESATNEKWPTGQAPYGEDLPMAEYMDLVAFVYTKYPELHE
ncbi:hypothetical protein P170DRAFT_477968 [Aspergillus steynii IBT 23096]|uniref:F-box domain-containing protein n=1 Tax=Aspergillus steynii IBT 23096 TaxID=1392250 RepID=A0A2I2G2L0_9EURO|nr:uncharacterized protein P170DRAFT_477968 [Aspergillus steynii IBT 23096]PLB47106.1 hypothetical protein P170DRAFT_477968 [Aspergillus steynii IBT 23096]